MAQAALAATGGLLGAAGSIQQGQAEYAAADYNAKMAEENARQSRIQSAEEARRQKISSAKQIGDIRASYGASGIVSSEGSALDILQESSAAAALDYLTIKHQGEVKAAAYQQEANVSRMRGNAARTGSYFKAASSLLSAAGSTASKAG
jgi:hypothetical protein